MKEIFKVIGYTPEMQTQGVLPEEFIWERILNSSSAMHTPCFKKHVIEYMLKNSPSFKEKYSEQCVSWNLEHANARVASRKFCQHCEIKQFCSSLPS